jgi:hypothetical protein
MKKKATDMESKGGPSQMTARVCLPRYRALLQRFMTATTENQQAKMAFKGASVDRLAQQARMMRQFDGVSGSLASLSNARTCTHTPFPVWSACVLQRVVGWMMLCFMWCCLQQSDEDLREDLERDPDLITKTVQKMAHGEVMAEYAMAQQKEQDVRELMRDIEEIATMAKEISELVDAQSEVIDKIVTNIDTTHDYGERILVACHAWFRCPPLSHACFRHGAVLPLPQFNRAKSRLNGVSRRCELPADVCAA